MFSFPETDSSSAPCGALDKERGGWSKVRLGSLLEQLAVGTVLLIGY